MAHTPFGELLSSFTACQSFCSDSISASPVKSGLELMKSGKLDSKPPCMTELAALSLEVAPITLKDVRDVWAWKRDIVMPLCKRLDLTCGPAFRGVNESHLTVCEDAELALFAWAIYGELFDHNLCLDWLDSTAKLNSIARFKFMVYCVPDVNSFNYMNLQTPQWFQDLHGRGESFQQLSLMHAMSDELTTSGFEADLMRLMDVEVPLFLFKDDPDPVDPSKCEEWQLFVHIVMNSGRRSHDVMRSAHLARQGQQGNFEALVAWLWDTWALVEQNMSIDIEKEQVSTTSTLNYTGDQWLE
jgi:hypothetical protein